MRDLIKKILKEFDSDNVVSFRIIGKADEFLNEQLSQEDKNKLQSIVRKKIKSINPFFGSYFDKRTNKDIEVEFNIIPKNHYIDRTLRLSDVDYKPGGKYFNPNIMNPEIFEGIELLVKNADELAKLIITKRIQDNDVVEFSTRDGSNYHMIVKFEPRSLSDIVFNLLLLTQIKGVRFFDKKNQKEFYLNK
jgi:hypothetical protein